MSAQQNKQIARQVCEKTWGKGNLAVADELANHNFKVYSIVKGKITEERGQEDALGVLQQLGLIPNL